MCVLIGTENAYHANTKRHRQREEVALQIQKVAPADSRGGHHHVCGVALCSMWHFALRVDTEGSPTDSRGGPYRFKRWPPPRVSCGTLLCVVLYSVWGMDSRGGPHGFKRWPLPCVWCGTLFRVALSSIQDPPDASTIAVSYTHLTLPTIYSV